MWKSFLTLNGLRILNCLLSEHKSQLEIVRTILRIFEKIPISNRNCLDDLKLIEQLGAYLEHGDVILSTVSKRVMNIMCHVL